MSSISRSSDDNLSEIVDGASDENKLSLLFSSSFDVLYFLFSKISGSSMKPRLSKTILLFLHEDLAVDYFYDLFSSEVFELFLPNVQSISPVYDYYFSAGAILAIVNYKN